MISGLGILLFLLVTATAQTNCHSAVEWRKQYVWLCMKRDWKPDGRAPELAFDIWDYNGRPGTMREKRVAHKKEQAAYLEGFANIKISCPIVYNEWLEHCNWSVEYKKLTATWGRG